ncbi:hypothetical protein J6590_039262 [Homalodisca vitripennis]|nr:hypothetical protein J6590_039262 [Homalodisca vitripennis]
MQNTGKLSNRKTEMDEELTDSPEKQSDSIPPFKCRCACVHCYHVLNLMESEVGWQRQVVEASSCQSATCLEQDCRTIPRLTELHLLFTSGTSL